MSRRTLRTPPESLDRFVQILAQGATVAEACTAAGIARQTAYAHRQRDEAFALRWADALEDGTEALEKEARRRAMDGSDHLLMFLLKARRPEAYRERAEVRHSGAIRQPSAKELEISREIGMDPEWEDKAVELSREYARRMRLAEGETA